MGNEWQSTPRTLPCLEAAPAIAVAGGIVAGRFVEFLYASAAPDSPVKVDSLFIGYVVVAGKCRVAEAAREGFNELVCGLTTRGF